MRRSMASKAWVVLLGVLLPAMGAARAAQLPNRIAGEIGDQQRVPLHGSVTHRPATATALGPLAGSTRLTRMSLVLAPTPAQQADLDRLLQNQQDRGSADYHRWLTPEQFGTRFGVSEADLNKMESWLENHGLTVDSVPASRNAILFSGPASAVEQAFAVSMQRFRRGGQEFFENSGEVQIPRELSGVVSGVTSLSSYRLQSHLVRRGAPLAADGARVRPDYTSPATGRNYIAPADFRWIYGLSPLIAGGYTGNAKIAVIGQSAVDTSQIGIFQGLTGQAVTAPTLVLVPNSGVSTAVPGDEGESEIDIEYAGGTAPGAKVQFVYTGNSSNNGVFDAMIYAITNNLAPILTLSYGGCERDFSTYAPGTLEPFLRQANAQGETILVSSGDSDSATCDDLDAGGANVPTATEGLTISYPASSPYVTAVGGTGFNEGTGTYWNPGNSSTAESAIGYIPETVWNDSASAGSILGSGGGASKMFSKPSWQAGPGVPVDGRRDIPDVAFASAVYHDPYVFCSAEVFNGVASEACSSAGFARSVGGTSLAAPNFAAMLAIVEQASGSGALGNINGLLYGLAAGASAGTVFHDVTVGDNQVACAIGTPDCTTGTMGFSAGAGYDQATGLGSITGAGLAAALAGMASTKAPTVAITASPQASDVNTAIVFTAAVSSANSATAPTGTVQFTIDGTSVGTVTLSSGIAAYSDTAGFATAGPHTIVAAYSGDANYSPASSTLTQTIGAPVTVSGSFTLASSPSTLTIASGSAGKETIAVTPSDGFAGSVNFTVRAQAATTSTAALSGCYSIPNVAVSLKTPTSAIMTVYTSAAQCTAAGRIPIVFAAAPTVAGVPPPPRPGSLPGRGTTILLGGALLGGFALRRRSRLPLLMVLAICTMALPGLGCGGGKSTSATTTPPGTGTTPTSAGSSYTITVTGSNGTAGTIRATTTYTLTIQ